MATRVMDAKKGIIEDRAGQGQTVYKLFFLT